MFWNIIYEHFNWYHGFSGRWGSNFNSRNTYLEVFYNILIEISKVFEKIIWRIYHDLQNGLQFYDSETFEGHDMGSILSMWTASVMKNFFHLARVLPTETSNYNTTDYTLWYFLIRIFLRPSPQFIQIASFHTSYTEWERMDSTKFLWAYN